MPKIVIFSEKCYSKEQKMRNVKNLNADFPNYNVIIFYFTHKQAIISQKVHKNDAFLWQKLSFFRHSRMLRIWLISFQTPAIV